MYKIERNIPVPSRTGRPSKYPFKDMKIGDSFAAPSSLTSSVKTCAFRFAKNKGGKFSFRVHDGKVRCWRIK